MLPNIVRIDVEIGAGVRRVDALAVVEPEVVVARQSRHSGRRPWRESKTAEPSKENPRPRAPGQLTDPAADVLVIPNVNASEPSRCYSGQ
jgi:hypothetical protein